MRSHAMRCLLALAVVLGCSRSPSSRSTTRRDPASPGDASESTAPPHTPLISEAPEGAVQPEPLSPRDTAVLFLEACENEDRDTIRSLIHPEATPGWERLLENPAKLSEGTTYHVLSERIEGNEASVSIRYRRLGSRGGGRDSMDLRKHEGRWLVTGL